jgi:hypothetical protein
MLFFTNWDINRESEVVLETGRIRADCNSLIAIDKFSMEMLKEGKDGGCMHRSAQNVRFSFQTPPDTQVEILPASGPGAD